MRSRHRPPGTTQRRDRGIPGRQGQPSWRHHPSGGGRGHLARARLRTSEPAEARAKVCHTAQKWSPSRPRDRPFAVTHLFQEGLRLHANSQAERHQEEPRVGVYVGNRWTDASEATGGETTPANSVTSPPADAARTGQDGGAGLASMCPGAWPCWRRAGSGLSVGSPREVTSCPTPGSFCRFSQPRCRPRNWRPCPTSPATPGAPTPSTPTSCGSGSPGARPTDWTRSSGFNVPTSRRISASSATDR